MYTIKDFAQKSASIAKTYPFFGGFYGQDSVHEKHMKYQDIMMIISSCMNDDDRHHDDSIVHG